MVVLAQVLGILHSAQLYGLLSARFLGACGAALRRVGAGHDAAGATTTAARPPLATGELKADSPQLLRSLPDRAVLYKPEGLAWAIVGDMYVINYVSRRNQRVANRECWISKQQC